MSLSNAMQTEETFASGRYSKRKRTQITYTLEELEVSDSESDYESPRSKKQKARITSRPLPKRKIFPFMELPAEIRNLIYTIALTDSSGINLIGTFKHRRRTVERVSEETMMKVSGTDRWSSSRLNKYSRATNTEPASLVASLLAVNKQIYQEARDMLYGNVFIFADSFALYSFLINLSPVSCKYLKTISLLGWGFGRAMKAYNHACFSTLVSATNITTFHIDARIGYYRAPKGAVEQLYRDAFPWMEAIGAASGRADAVLDVLQFGDNCFDTVTFFGEQTQDVRRQQRVDEFKAALSELLNAQQNRVIGSPVKKRKKTSKRAISDEP